MATRTAILEHMIDIAHLILDHHIRGYSSIQEYITHNSMDSKFAWGTDIEMLTLAHLLQPPVVSYSVQYSTWQRYAPHDLDRTLSDDQMYNKCLCTWYICITILRWCAQYESIDIDTPHELKCVTDACKWTELSVIVKRG